MLNKYKCRILTTVPRQAIKIEASSDFLIFLLENKNIFIRNLKTKKKLESSISGIADISLVKYLDLLIAINYKQEMLVFDINENKVIITVQLTENIKYLLSSDYKPFILAYGDSGFVDVYMALTGDLIDRIGPFYTINALFFDEDKKVLSILENDLKIRVIACNINITPNKNNLADNDDQYSFISGFDFLSPNIFHSFTKNRPKQEELKISNEIFTKNIVEIIKSYEYKPEDRMLTTLEKMTQQMKLDIDLTQNDIFFYLLHKVNRIKYEAGIKSLSYDMIIEEFSFCQNIDYKFDIIVKSFALSKDKRFFAVGCHPGIIKIYLTSQMRTLYSLSDPGAELVSLAFTPDSKFLIIARDVDEVEIWSMASGKQTHKVNLTGKFFIFLLNF